MLNTPILFLIFNRPDVTARVFKEIKKQKPKNLYVAADGPRIDKQGEAELCEQTRQIATNIDWDCEVKTLFKEENLGCKQAVSQGITWFFKNVEEGIILEDDCLPHPDFFSFCEQMLEKYRDNDQVMHISGETQLNENMTDDSYYFSYIPHIWGWASWKRAWGKYDADVRDFPSFKKSYSIKKITNNKYHQSDWLKIFEKMYRHEIDAWGYQWCYALFKNKGLSIIPNKNLISNIGFGKNATHTTEIDEFANKTTSPMDKTLIHPEALEVDKIIFNEILIKRYNMQDKFSIERHKYLKILLREVNRALFKAGLKK